MIKIIRKKIIWIGAGVCAVALFLFWMSEKTPEQTSMTRAAAPAPALVRNLDFSGLKFTNWDYRSAAANITGRTRKPYTIMVYMNGSDLESEEGMATSDLAEMLESGMDSSKIHLVLFTGGANRWQNEVIPENYCALWEISDGKLMNLTDLPLLNMGDPGTLTGFINFAYEAFPAEKYGLILWDHGGGAIAGYGQDENFESCNLTLLEMNYAFAKSAMAKTKLEFLGFDSCLMAAVEMAVVASDYSRYMIASEDLEPGEGWSYNFLKAISKKSDMNGALVGQNIIDTFMQYYGRNSEESLTLSLIDLSQVSAVMNAMGGLMARCEENITEMPSFRTLARKRSGTKTFGEGSPKDNECDMVDIGDMAVKLQDLFPKESKNLLQALENAVIYNRHNSDSDLRGLSAYYIYGGKDIASYTLDTYESIQMDKTYTEYQKSFSEKLRITGSVSRSSGITPNEPPVTEELTTWKPLPDKPGHYIMTGIQDEHYRECEGCADPIESGVGNHQAPLWPFIEGRQVCLSLINSGEFRKLYAVPAELNGVKCDILVLISKRFPTGKILGSRHDDGLIIQKGHDTLQPGDQIAFSYLERDFSDGREIGWVNGETFTVDGDVTLEWFEADQDILTCTMYTDVFGKQTYGKFK